MEEKKILFTGIDYDVEGLYLVFNDGTRIDLGYEGTLDIYRMLLTAMKLLRRLHKAKKVS